MVDYVIVINIWTYLKIWKKALYLNSFLFTKLMKRKKGKVANGRGVICICSEVKMWNQCYQNAWSDFSFAFSQI